MTRRIPHNTHRRMQFQRIGPDRAFTHATHYRRPRTAIHYEKRGVLRRGSNAMRRGFDRMKTGENRYGRYGRARWHDGRGEGGSASAHNRHCRRRKRLFGSTRGSGSGSGSGSTVKNRCGRCTAVRAFASGDRTRRTGR